MTRKETLKNKIVMIGSGKSAPFYLLTEKCLTAKYFELSVTTKTSKDIPTGMYTVNTYITNADAYPSDKKVIIKFPISARSKSDAGRPGMISYRDSDGFIGVAYSQPNTDMIISCVAFFI